MISIGEYVNSVKDWIIVWFVLMGMRWLMECVKGVRLVVRSVKGQWGIVRSVKEGVQIL